MTDNEQTAPAISVSVSVDFGEQRVLDDVRFSVANGEFVSILGPSGCGKSTVLRTIAGLNEATEGTLKISPTTARTAFVFQDPVLLPWRTVKSNIAIPLELEGQPCSTERILDSLRLVGLSPDDAKKRPHMLSGGMRMRVSLARALVTEPDILLLDEPFAALDEILRQQLNEELLQICAAKKCTTVFVTHNVAEAVFLSQRVIVMSANPGRISTIVPVQLAHRQESIRTTPEFVALTSRISQKLRETKPAVTQP